MYVQLQVHRWGSLKVQTQRPWAARSLAMVMALASRASWSELCSKGGHHQRLHRWEPTVARNLIWDITGLMREKRRRVLGATGSDNPGLFGLTGTGVGRSE
jgi:hypothetical protein